MSITDNNIYKNLLIRGFCVFILLFSFFGLYAQNEINEKKLLKQARKDLYKEKYDDAKQKYSSLIKANPTNSIYNFEGGLSYYFSNQERIKSTPLLENAINTQNEEEDFIPEMYYFLGKSYQLNNEFEKSNEAFQKFIPYVNKNTKAGKELLAEVSDEINYNTNGKEYLTKIDKSIKISNLGEKINTIDNEYAPVWNQSGEVLVFTSRRKNGSKKVDKGDLLPFEDIYAAKKTDNGWELITNSEELKKYLPSNINTPKHDASITYSLDEKSLFTYKKDAIWESKFENGTWSDLKKLDDNLNSSKFNVPSVTLSNDGNTIFFVSVRQDGIGGKDIYQATKNSNGEWENPVLLNNINTPKDEDAPFLTKDGNTLFFSSKGHNSMGGYDIFKSELINGDWSTPINLGMPFNSQAHDIYYTTDVDNKNVFFASSRENGFGTMDIYMLDTECKNIPEVEINGIVYDSQTKLPLNTSFSLLSDNDTIYKTRSDNGNFSINATPESNYKLVIKAENYTLQTISLETPKQCEEYSQFIEIALTTLNENQVLDLKYARFDIENEIRNYIDNGRTLEDNNITNRLSFISKKDAQKIAFTQTIIDESKLDFIEISDTIVGLDLIVEKNDSLPINTTSNTDQISSQFDNLLFAFNSSSLNPDSKKTLNKIVDYLRSNKNSKLEIIGYTDASRDFKLMKQKLKALNIPYTEEAATKLSKEYNLELSRKRAEKAANYLTSKGINSNNIIIKYFGETNPIAPNTNEDGSNNEKNQALNRRVTFSVLP